MFWNLLDTTFERFFTGMYMECVSWKQRIVVGSVTQHGRVYDEPNGPRTRARANFLRYIGAEMEGESALHWFMCRACHRKGNGTAN